VFAFFIVELESRRVVHVAVTRSPTDDWVAQQLREATPEEARPRFLIHDRDATYGPAFVRVAAASGIAVLRTPVRAPRANAVCERFLGSVRRECLDTQSIIGWAWRSPRSDPCLDWPRALTWTCRPRGPAGPERSDGSGVVTLWELCRRADPAPAP
jgi:transposase InsO family protein